MADSIQVDIDSINNAAQKIANAINSIAQVHQDLNSCNERLKSSWEGQSQKKYYTQYDKIANKFTDYTEGLQSMATDLNQIIEYFQELESQLVSEIMKTQVN